MTAPELRITDAEVAAVRRQWEFCATFPIRGLTRSPTARLGAILLAAMPHLRHAVWPPRRERAGRGGLGMALAMAAMGGRR